MENKKNKKFIKGFIKPKKLKIVSYISVVAVVLITFAVVYVSSSAAKFDFLEKSDKLRDYIFSNADIEETVSSELGDVDYYTIFLTIGDRKSRAEVVNGLGSSLSEAWEEAQNKARKLVAKSNRDIIYIKADLVNNMEVVKSNELAAMVKSEKYHQYFRLGISFDADFKTAFLEAEINGNKLIDYKGTSELNLKTINKYLKDFGRKTVKKIPDEITLFNSRGYIYDDGEFYTLYHEQNANYGRRITDTLEKEAVKDVVYTGSRFVSDLVGEDGKFIYGYYPTYDNKINGYNILRHAGTLWSMICSYNVTKDKTLLPEIDKAMSFLLGEIEYKDNKTAYVVERNSNEIKLGANGIALLAILDYMNTFGTDEYDDIALKIGNGILDLLDKKTGKYYHVLYYNEPGMEDFGRKEEVRTVFYDGEATFALCKLYSRYNDKKWLDAACTAADYFIAEDYTKLKDHWLSYAFNELTKYVQEEKYFEFGLRNVQENFGKINNKVTTSHTDLELIMSAFELYNRIIENNIQVDYLEKFDSEAFIDMIFYRADYNMNAYAYSEFFIYLKNPAHIEGSFFVRNDGFRIRIDDVQHHIGGYCLYVNNYDKLMMYK